MRITTHSHSLALYVRAVVYEKIRRKFKFEVIAYLWSVMMMMIRLLCEGVLLRDFLITRLTC